MDYSILDENSNDEEKSIHDEEFLEKLFELKEKYKHEADLCWIKISEELQTPVEKLKMVYADTLSSYNNNRIDIASKLHEIIHRREADLFEYAFENFADLCRFCFKLRADNDAGTMEEIFEDSSDESLDLILKINFTLYGNIFEKLEHKLSNLICKTCKSRIIEFYEFKKQCGINIEILLQVKNELDRSVGKDIPKKTDDNDILDSVESPSEDKIEECSEKKAISRKSRTTKSKSASKKSLKGSQCSICGKIVIGISMHMMIHSGTKKFSCQYCPKTFTQSGQLKRHVNSHLDIRNYECPVSGCERKFVDPSSVTKHLVIHNKDDRKFQCSLCGSRFNRLGALRYHEKTHRQERNHHCDLCNKSFLAKYDLTKHYRTHTGEKPYSCPYCDKKFSISKNAKVHLRVHTKEKPYDCKFCDMKFSYRSSMKHHLTRIHNHADVSNLPAMYSEERETNRQHLVVTELQSETIQFVHEIHTS